MSQLFNLLLTTEHGSMETSIRANSLEQITANLPAEFIDCKAEVSAGTQDDETISTDDVMLEVFSVMNLIEDHPRIQALLSQ